METVIVLKIVSGNFDSGFSVGLQVWDERGGFPSADKSGYLPPHPHLEGYYFNWQTSFRKLNGRNRSDDFGFDENLPGLFSSDDDREACHQFAKLLEQNMKIWLLETVDAGWQKIREKVVEELAENRGNVRIMIQASPQLWKMPWLEWDVFDNPKYPDLGIGFSPLEYKKPKSIPRSGKEGAVVRILAVFGNNDNIDLEPDKQAIAQLPNAELERLEQPSAAEVIQKLRDKRGWDIFFFAGHSQTKGDEGIIYINERESLEIGQFKEALKEAIRQGLQLAIFNSCDGLGLAEKLAALQLPIAIVMKEPVPDKVAQRFLTEFLTEYASGAYLYTAVRRSQKCLEEFAEFPGCTGLPIVCQNPAEVPPTWEELRGRKTPDNLAVTPEKRPDIDRRVQHRERRLFSWRRVKLALTASLIIATLVMGMRWQGKLERWELPAYDYLMQQRPIDTKPDRRILVIRVTAEDKKRLNQPLQETGQSARTLSDRTLESLLEKLHKMQPLVIGLNMWRPGEIDSAYPTLKSILQQENVIGTCVAETPDKEKGHEPRSAPEGVTKDRTGFDDVVLDKLVIRRQLLLMKTSNPLPCQGKEINSFSLRIAEFYLKHHNIKRLDKSPDNFIQFGDFKISPLEFHQGGYHTDPNVGKGIQVILNYKPYSDYRQDIVSSVTLTDFFNDQLTREDLKNKIVLIGVENSEDWYVTPYSKWNSQDEEIPGVFLHAQMISHIIDVVEGNRPLIWAWPWWGDGLWIWIWSLVGGVMTANWLQSRSGHSRAYSIFNLALSSTIVLGILYGLCLGFLLVGGWLPLVPSALALLMTGMSVIFYTVLEQQQNP